MRKHKISFDKAYQLVRSRRSVVDINEGFQKELRQNEKDLMAKEWRLFFKTSLFTKNEGFVFICIERWYK